MKCIHRSWRRKIDNKIILVCILCGSEIDKSLVKQKKLR